MEQSLYTISHGIPHGPGPTFGAQNLGARARAGAQILGRRAHGARAGPGTRVRDPGTR